MVPECCVRYRGLRRLGGIAAESPSAHSMAMFENQGICGYNVNSARRDRIVV